MFLCININWLLKFDQQQYGDQIINIEIVI